MDNFTVVSNIFVLVAFFLITCPNEGNGYSRLEYGSVALTDPRRLSSLDREISWPSNEIEESDDVRFLLANFPNQFATVAITVGEQGEEPVERYAKERSTDDSFVQNRLAQLRDSQKDYLNSIPFGWKPNPLNIWPPRT